MGGLTNMSKLNDYQLSVLYAGAREEIEKDVRIHDREPHETCGLLFKYHKYHDGIAAEALLDLFDFWACYFTCGADIAFKIRDYYHNQFLKEAAARNNAFELTNEVKHYVE